MVESVRYKFRAWEKKLKEMITVSTIDFRKGMINTDSLWRYFHEVELMQFTGLTDINGKEIYEGDIVKAWNRGISGTFQVKWRSDGVPMYILFPAWQDGEFWNLYDNGSGIDGGIEVIGNIYQHKHLLKENEQ